MQHVLVLNGGNSHEREVSLRSGQAVADALEQAGYAVSTYDTINGLLDAPTEGIDVVFPALHGIGGEDGVLQKHLETMGLPFVGSGSAASELCIDKWKFKQFLQAHNVPHPHGELIDKDTFWQSEYAQKPFVLKPYDGGSSIDTFIVRDALAADKTAIQAAFEAYEHMLVEELIEGIETTVTVLNDQALPMVEIIPPSDGEFDYDNKYNGKTQELCPPQNVSRDLQKQAGELARIIHKEAGCQDISRTDIIIRDSSLFVLETNTLPGFTEQSLTPKAAQAAGISMSALVDQLVQAALKRAA